jgi:hypothetical protein
MVLNFYLEEQLTRDNLPNGKAWSVVAPLELPAKHKLGFRGDLPENLYKDFE